MIFEVGWLTFMVSAVSATIIISAMKWGWIEWFEIRGYNVCRFCVGFWLCVAQALALYFFYSSNIFYIAIPFAGASICRKLLEIK